MVELTEKAQSELTAYFEDKDMSPVRIHLAPGGCSGPRLALALDEPNDQDEVFESNGFKFIIEKALNEQVGNITIDMTHMGFTVDAENPIAGGGSCCSSCGSSCG